MLLDGFVKVREEKLSIMFYIFSYPVTDNQLETGPV